VLCERDGETPATPKGYRVSIKAFTGRQGRSEIIHKIDLWKAAFGPVLHFQLRHFHYKNLAETSRAGLDCLPDQRYPVCVLVEKRAYEAPTDILGRMVWPRTTEHFAKICAAGRHGQRNGKPSDEFPLWLHKSGRLVRHNCRLSSNASVACARDGRRQREPDSAGDFSVNNEGLPAAHR
jgi:hypothetical protein